MYTPGFERLSEFLAIVDLFPLPWSIVALLESRRRSNLSLIGRHLRRAALGSSEYSLVEVVATGPSRSCDDLLAKVTVLLSRLTIHRHDARLSRRHCVTHPTRVSVN